VERKEIANAIMNIHCDVTGAPETFVHVFFFPKPGIDNHAVNGSIRKGRDESQREAIHSRIVEAYSTVAGIPRNEVRVSTLDVPSKWVMEGGSLLPEPGEEDAWLATHQK
jgi:phenylpyruvate tautomerase PptA (4-oxalocrotonate tautomerase family)